MREDEPLVPDGYLLDGPLPNRFTRGTVLGCAGLLCVLAMPALLFLPIEQWAPPLWVALLVPLLAFAMAALGAWMLARVPASSPIRSHNPEHPLTTAGTPPLFERPARFVNHLAVCVVVVLILISGVGYALASTSRLRLDALERGVLLSGFAGIALIVDGLLIAGRRLPIPAMRWVRMPVQSNFSRQGAPVVLVGLVWLSWALWVALGAGIGLGAGGLALLTLIAVLAAPLARRTPRWGASSAWPPDGERLPARDTSEDTR